MAERPEDLNLPNAVITRIIKDALPDGVNVSKEARLAISKAASVFVLYATSCSNNFALKFKRKTITAKDVLDALEDMEFDQFIQPLTECLEAFRKTQQGKKDQKKKEKEKETAVQQQKADEEEAVEIIDSGETDDSETSDTKSSSTSSSSSATGMEAEEEGGGGEVVEISDTTDE